MDPNGGNNYKGELKLTYKLLNNQYRDVGEPSGESRSNRKDEEDEDEDEEEESKELENSSESNELDDENDDGQDDEQDDKKAKKRVKKDVSYTKNGRNSLDEHGVNKQENLQPGKKTSQGRLLGLLEPRPRRHRRNELGYLLSGGPYYDDYYHTGAYYSPYYGSPYYGYSPGIFGRSLNGNNQKKKIVGRSLDAQTANVEARDADLEDDNSFAGEYTIKKNKNGVQTIRIRKPSLLKKEILELDYKLKFNNSDHKQQKEKHPAPNRSKERAAKLNFTIDRIRIPPSVSKPEERDFYLAPYEREVIVPHEEERKSHDPENASHERDDHDGYNPEDAANDSADHDDMAPNGGHHSSAFERDEIDDATNFDDSSEEEADDRILASGRDEEANDAEYSEPSEANDQGHAFGRDGEARDAEYSEPFEAVDQDLVSGRDEEADSDEFADPKFADNANEPDWSNDENSERTPETQPSPNLAANPEDRSVELENSEHSKQNRKENRDSQPSNLSENDDGENSDHRTGGEKPESASLDGSQVDVDSNSANLDSDRSNKDSEITSAKDGRKSDENDESDYDYQSDVLSKMGDPDEESEEKTGEESEEEADEATGEEASSEEVNDEKKSGDNKPDRPKYGFLRRFRRDDSEAEDAKSESRIYIGVEERNVNEEKQEVEKKEDSKIVPKERASNNEDLAKGEEVQPKETKRSDKRNVELNELQVNEYEVADGVEDSGAADAKGTCIFYENDTEPSFNCGMSNEIFELEVFEGC